MQCDVGFRSASSDSTWLCFERMPFIPRLKSLVFSGIVIKITHPDTKVIIMAGYDSVEYRKAAIRCGANGYIVQDFLNSGQIGKLVKPVIPELNKRL